MSQPLGSRGHAAQLRSAASARRPPSPLINAVGRGCWRLPSWYLGWEWASGPPPRAARAGPCVTVVIASPIGGEDLQHCGADARKWCTTEAAAASGDNVASQVRAACRRAGVLPALSTPTETPHQAARSQRFANSAR